MTDESMAEEAGRNFAPVGKESYASYLHKNMADIGALSGDQRWRLPFPELFGDSLAKVLEDAAADLASAFTTLGRGERLSRLVVKATSSQSVSTLYAPKEDESGLVLVSDSLAALCTSYCRHVGWELSSIFETKSMFKAFLRFARAHFKGSLVGDPARLASVLRYHHANRRAHGVATVVITRQDRRDEDGSRHHDAADLFLLLTIRFLLGHEMAHHVLAHQVECSQSPEQESQADFLALQAVNLVNADAMIQHASGIPFVRRQWLEECGEFYGLVSAVIGMSAVQSLEEALMVRRGRTHRPARERAARLVELSLSDARIHDHERALGRRDASFRKRIDSERYGLELLTRSLAEATDRAADFGASPTGFDWVGLTPAEVVAPSESHVREVVRLDGQLRRPDESLAAALADSPLRDGALYALAGDTRRAMRAWKVPDAMIRTAHDETTALAFYALVHFIRTASEAYGLSDDDLRELPVVAATLLARRLPRGE
ncbi:hypothetical protein ACSNOK_10110 [Streptomyces sp. URMC 126]|uniref:hypothetical protein n=1 Tax=Streptomyces sp. URMC 126 TaxID=3423401 RepID=UPI003F1E00BF